MATLWWLAVTLALFLSAGNTLAGGSNKPGKINAQLKVNPKKQAENVNLNMKVNAKKLAGIVNNILNRFRPSYTTQDGTVRNPMFSVAVAVPFYSSTQRFDMNLVCDDGDRVREKILNCAVYEGQRMVAATVLRWPDVLDQCPKSRVQWTDVLRRCGKQSMTWAEVQTSCSHAVSNGRADHAEYRTLQRFGTLVNKPNKEDLLVFYVYASPCGNRCANPDDSRNILNLIKSIKGWKNYVFVFSKVFKPRDGSTIPDSELKEAVSKIGDSIGLGNIFRCDGSAGWIHCTSCSTDGDVTPRCYKNN
ncbi:uncharacterized protein LOC113127949 [Mastacembelus armatus]|uniref:uncharacterized protein LOC113127949 n=1 Tax=Mastacembelus armatus TaxID=205130 RepID=UPI000E456C28|nr:uncharacterized protein LOC113127949 [Mastacembelus armatus]XP_026158685.1 uncharacterized protein LOC113127949 [Mastacembelus armatus]